MEVATATGAKNPENLRVACMDITLRLPSFAQSDTSSFHMRHFLEFWNLLSPVLRPECRYSSRRQSSFPNIAVPRLPNFFLLRNRAL